MLLLSLAKNQFLELTNKSTVRNRRTRHTIRKSKMLFIRNHQIRQHVLIVGMIIQEIDVLPKDKSAIIAMVKIILQGYVHLRRIQGAENNLFVGTMQDR